MYSVLCVQYEHCTSMHCSNCRCPSQSWPSCLLAKVAMGRYILVRTYMNMYVCMYVCTCHMLQAYLVLACALHAPLLAAHKKDEWIAVDPRSGAKLYTVSSAGVNSYCPADSSGEDVILLGKSCELFVHFACCM